MPTDQSTPNAEFAQRLRTCMRYFGYEEHGGNKRFADAYGVSGPVVTDWRKGRYMPEYSKIRKMAAEFECSADWLYSGEGSAPAWMSKEAEEAPAAKPIFTKERRASDDVLALQIGLESLLVAVLQRTPGAAEAFLADVKPVAKGHGFSMKAGLLGSLVDIAQRVRSEEEAAAQVRQRAGSVGRTKREKPDQAR